MNSDVRFTSDWRRGWLALTAFSVFLLLSFVTLALPAVPFVELDVPWTGILQLLTLLLMMGIVFCTATFTPFLNGPRHSTFPLVLLLSFLGYTLVRSVATAFCGTATLPPLLVALLVLLALISGVAFAFNAYTGFRASQYHVQLAFVLDPLTSVLNRAGFQRVLTRLGTAPAVLAVLDINQLKAINDLHGHSGGDRYLQAVSRQLNAHLAADVSLCRWGGDEFLAVFPGATTEEVRHVLTAAQLQIQGLLPGVPAFSFGISALNAANPFERAFALADQEMYSRKPLPGRADAAGSVDLGLYAFSRQLETLMTPDEVIRTGLRLVRGLLQFDIATYIEARENQMFARSLHQEMEEQFSLPGFSLGVWMPVAPMPAQAIETKRTVISVDYPSDPLALPVWVQAGVKTTVLTPILISGEVVGLLTLIHLGTWKSVTLEMQRMLELAALRFGHVLQLFQVAETTRLNLEGGLLGLGVALEARDLETRGHTERVVEMAVRLGTMIGLTGQALDDLRQGAFLHDIGKLSIPDAILLKPGALTPDEWAVMKSHTVLGADIASRIPSLSPGALDVIRHHHERWDGSGYPDRLVGEQIDLKARIFSVCDVFDALTHERPYKAAWSREEARAEIASQRERQFCPLVVDTFLALTASEPEETERR